MLFHVQILSLRIALTDFFIKSYLIYTSENWKLSDQSNWPLIGCFALNQCIMIPLRILILNNNDGQAQVLVI